MPQTPATERIKRMGFDFVYLFLPLRFPRKSFQYNDYVLDYCQHHDLGRYSLKTVFLILTTRIAEQSQCVTNWESVLPLSQSLFYYLCLFQIPSYIIQVRQQQMTRTEVEDSSHFIRRNRPRKYDKISYETRKELVRLVEQEGNSIYRASRILGVNNATAKVILRKYRATGVLLFKKSDIAIQNITGLRQTQNAYLVNQAVKIDEIVMHWLFPVYPIFETPFITYSPHFYS